MLRLRVSDRPLQRDRASLDQPVSLSFSQISGGGQIVPGLAVLQDALFMIDALALVLQRPLFAQQPHDLRLGLPLQLQPLFVPLHRHPPAAGP